ncbi:MAG: molybdopterin synthase sulfur carrier subunit [Anaerolineaceae bacterium]|nr:molybdopterin synthase sulfur carrier subunit [Anaerolineaceae bacterium]
MEIHLKLFANYRNLFPPGTDGYQLTLTIPDNSTVNDVLAMFSVPQAPESVVLVNGKTHLPDELLKNGDVISAFPAMAGGNH